MNQRRVLVTGINGFVGKHLARELNSHDIAVIGCGHEDKAHPEIVDICQGYYGCDLSDPEQVASLTLDGIDAVINLAGLANVGASTDDPEEYLRTNVAVHSVLCDELLRRGLHPRVVAVSTGGVYSSDQPMPQSEIGLLVDDDKTSPYVVSKKLMEQAMHGYRDRGLDIVIARPFNHIGPGQRPGFLIPDLADQIINTKDSTLMVGNLNTKRDYTDVRDVVRAYGLLALSKTLQLDTYNICSGVSRSGLEMLEMLKREFGRDDLRVEIDRSRIRPNDVMDIYGDSSMIRSELGWRPEIPIDQTIKDFVAWRLNQ